MRLKSFLSMDILNLTEQRVHELLLIIMTKWPVCNPGLTPTMEERSDYRGSNKSKSKQKLDKKNNLCF